MGGDRQDPKMRECVEMRVARLQWEAERVVSIDLCPLDGDEAPAWAPGAHVDLNLPSGTVRQYSLCGHPEDRGRLRVAVLRVDDGRGGSKEIHETVRPGQVIAVGGPRNHFPYELTPRQIFIAGGIGITPILAMVRAAHRGQVDWTLTYGGRSRASMAFVEALAALDPEGRRIDLVPEDEIGLPDLDRMLDRPDREKPETAIYCCGPEGMLAAVERSCQESWPAGALRVERFSPRALEPSTSGGFEVEFAQSGITCQVPADRSILEVAAERGVPVFSSCEEGTCGTCLTGVLEGDPEHRDSVLTEQERAAGDQMLICVSRSHGDRLVLDL